jgi:recombination protein RecT
MASTDLAAMQQQRAAAVVADMKPKEKVAYFLDQKKAEITKMLPKHLNAERLLKVAQIAATTTPALAECDVPSLVGAIGQCAQMGLEPNTVLGHAYLVPFNTKRKDSAGNERWVKSVQVIIGYKGLIDLARRSGQIVSIAAHEVCENDKFELVYGIDEKLNHTPALRDRGEVVGFYAVAKLKDGGHCCEFMSVEQIEKIREGSQGAFKDEWKNGKKTGARIAKDGPWWDHFVEMGRKTVIRRIAKYLPLSIEFQTAAALDGMAEAGKDQGITVDGDFNFINEDAPQLANETVDEATGEVQQTVPAKTDQQEPKSEEQHLTFAKVAESLNNAKDVDVLDVAADLISQVADEGQQSELVELYKARKEAILNPPKKAAAKSGMSVE